jgi:hypothetical protein
VDDQQRVRSAGDVAGAPSIVADEDGTFDLGGITGGQAMRIAVRSGYVEPVRCGAGLVLPRRRFRLCDRRLRARGCFGIDHHRDRLSGQDW